MAAATVSPDPLPTTLSDAPGALAVDASRVRAVDEALPAVWVPIVARTSGALEDPEAKLLATRWAKRRNQIEGGLVRTVGPLPDDGKIDPTRVGSEDAEGHPAGLSTADDYLRLAAAMNSGTVKRGHVLFCLVRANEAAY